MAVADVGLAEQPRPAGAVGLGVPGGAVLVHQPHLAAVHPRRPELVPHAAVTLRTHAEAVLHPRVTVHLHPLLVVLLLKHGRGGRGGQELVRWSGVGVGVGAAKVSGVRIQLSQTDSRRAGPTIEQRGPYYRTGQALL